MNWSTTTRRSNCSMTTKPSCRNSCIRKNKKGRFWNKKCFNIGRLCRRSLSRWTISNCLILTRRLFRRPRNLGLNMSTRPIKFNNFRSILKITRKILIRSSRRRSILRRSTSLWPTSCTPTLHLPSCLSKNHRFLLLTHQKCHRVQQGKAVFAGSKCSKTSLLWTKIYQEWNQFFPIVNPGRKSCCNWNSRSRIWLTRTHTFVAYWQNRRNRGAKHSWRYSYTRRRR